MGAAASELNTYRERCVWKVVVSAGVAGNAVAVPIADEATGGDTLADAPDAVAALLSSGGRMLLVESVVAAGRRAPRLRKSGGATMTIAVNSNARKKRLSIGSGPETDRL